MIAGYSAHIVRLLDLPRPARRFPELGRAARGCYLKGQGVAKHNNTDIFPIGAFHLARLLASPFVALRMICHFDFWFHLRGLGC